MGEWEARMTVIPLNFSIPSSIWAYWKGKENYLDALAIFLDPLGTVASLQDVWNTRTREKWNVISPAALLSLLLSLLPWTPTCQDLGLYTECPLFRSASAQNTDFFRRDWLLHYQLSGTDTKSGGYSPGLEHCFFICSSNWVQSCLLLGQIILQSQFCILLLLHGSISAVAGGEASACHSIAPSLGFSQVTLIMSLCGDIVSIF